jgi:hypothetical protein
MDITNSFFVCLVSSCFAPKSIHPKLFRSQVIQYQSCFPQVIRYPSGWVIPENISIPPQRKLEVNAPTPFGEMTNWGESTWGESTWGESTWG